MTLSTDTSRVVKVNQLIGRQNGRQVLYNSDHHIGGHHMYDQNLYTSEAETGDN